MAFTQAQRVQIERYMCWPPPHVNANYQAFVTSLQAVTDGGVMPDSARETAIIALLTQLASVQTRLENLWEQMQAGAVGDLRIDPPRAVGALRMEGRRLVHNLARALNATPLGDAFSAPSTVPIA